jgi:hypothetical protein
MGKKKENYGVVEGYLDDAKDMIPDSTRKFEITKVEVLTGPEDEKYILISLGKNSHVAFTKEQIEKFNKLLE